MQKWWYMCESRTFNILFYFQCCIIADSYSSHVVIIARPCITAHTHLPKPMGLWKGVMFWSSLPSRLCLEQKALACSLISLILCRSLFLATLPLSLSYSLAPHPHSGEAVWIAQSLTRSKDIFLISPLCCRDWFAMGPEAGPVMQASHQQSPVLRGGTAAGQCLGGTPLPAGHSTVVTHCSISAEPKSDQRFNTVFRDHLWICLSYCRLRAYAIDCIHWRRGVRFWIG